MIENILSRDVAGKAATIMGKKTDAAGEKLGATILRETAIDTSDKAMFSATASAADALDPAKLVAQLKAAKPEWTNDNRDAFKPYLDNLLNGIKDLRGRVAAPKTALDQATRDVAAADAKFRVPVDQAQAVLTSTDRQFRPAAEAANQRLAAAQGQLRTTMRPGADAAQRNLAAASSVVADARGRVAGISGADIESAVAPIDYTASNVVAAGQRIQANASTMASVGETLVNSADGTAQGVGQGVVAAGNGIAGDTAGMMQNASNLSYGASRIRAAQADVRAMASTVDGDLVVADQNFAFANDALSASPADDTVLAHARGVAAGGDSFVASRNALVQDFAGKNPGAVMGALDNASAAARDAEGRVMSIDPARAIDQDLATMDQTTAVIQQTASKMGQGTDYVRGALGGIQTADADLQGAIAGVSSSNEAIATDLNAIQGQLPALSTGNVRAVNDQIRQLRDGVATEAQTLDSYVANTRQALNAMPSDAQITGSATELVTAHDANAKAWGDLNNALAQPTKVLSDAQAQYASDMAPSKAAQAAAKDALSQVTVPLGQLEEFTRGIPDTVGTLTRMHWNNLINIFDHNKVDVNKVYQGEVSSIVGTL